MKQFKKGVSFKLDKDLKYYIIAISFINFIYLIVELFKNRYIKRNSLGEDILIEHYQYISKLSKIARFLEVIIILICVIYLIRFTMKKRSINTGEYFFIHIIFCIILTLISYSISAVLGLDMGSLQQLLVVYGNVILIFIYNMIYIKVFDKFKT